MGGILNVTEGQDMRIQRLAEIEEKLINRLKETTGK